MFGVFLEKSLILMLMETLTQEKTNRGNISQTIPAALIISISYWCSRWLFSKQLRLCQETANTLFQSELSAGSVWHKICVFISRCWHRGSQRRVLRPLLNTWWLWECTILSEHTKIHNVATQDLVNFLIIQSARGSLMLITFSQNTLHYREETARGLGGGGAGPVWCSGSTSVPFWALTGLLGSGLALCCYRRSFLSVKGLAVALLGDH